MAEGLLRAEPETGVTRRWRYRVARDRAAIGRFVDRLDRDLVVVKVHESARLAVATVLDELFANVLMHARDVRGPMHVRLRHRHDELVVRLRYNAMPFDPTAIQVMPLPSTIAEARIGGVGIALVRAMTREFVYRHRRGENHLRVRLGAGIRE
jgi:anti-sigma regulatory factor (Ser/Thr protein kinase)